MSYRRSLSYYKKLKQIPNVRVLNPGVDSHEIIRHSDLVTTITGTAGFEALMLQTPTITFGDCFYNSMPMVEQCHNPSNLSNLIDEILTGYGHDDRQLLEFLTAVFHESFEIPPKDRASPETRARALYPALKEKVFDNQSK